MSEMPDKMIYKAEVVGNERIADNIMKMTLSAPCAASAAPGRFANLYPDADSLILPRPVSICDADAGAGTLTFVYAVVGAGTAEFAGRRRGDVVRMSPPLGNGFALPLPQGAQGELPPHAVLVGGGVGTAPMVFLAGALVESGARVTVVAGFRARPFLIDELRGAGAKVLVATEKPLENAFYGNVTDCLRVNDLRADAYFACGPRPMLASVTEYVLRLGSDIQVSLEERMGCGYGACLGCVCDIKAHDGNCASSTIKKKVCSDGPVFMGSEVVWK